MYAMIKYKSLVLKFWTQGWERCFHLLVNLFTNLYQMENLKEKQTY